MSRPRPARVARAPERRAGGRMRTRLLLSLAGLLVIGLVTAGTLSAFSASTANPGNSLAAGTVVLADNDSSSAMFAMSAVKPGDSQSKCIQVTHSGTLPSTVHLYGANGGSGLAPYLSLTIARGTVSSGSFPDCSGFTADTTNWAGLGAGVIYSGNLSALAGTYAAGVVDASTSLTETWGQNETHAYQYTLTVQDTDSAQGLSATPVFTWEARNLDLACTARSPLFLTGAEHGALNTSTLGSLGISGGSALTADTAVVRSGTYSLKLAKVNGGQAWINTGLSSAPSVVVGRAFVRFETLPSTDVSEVLSVGYSGFRGYIGYVSSSQKFIARFQGGTTITPSTTVSAGQWYMLDFKADTSGATSTFDWRINGVAQSQATRATGSATTATLLSYGSSIGTEVFTTYYDDLLYTASAADYPLGDGHVLGLTPNAVTSTTDPSGYLKNDTNTAVDSSSWSRLDERPMTATSDYVKQTGVDTGASTGLDLDDPLGTGCVNGVQATVAYHSSASTANSAKTSLFDSGTERVVWSGAMNSTSLVQKWAVIAPASGAWDTIKLASVTARIGYASSVGSVPYWDGLMVEYDVTYM